MSLLALQIVPIVVSIDCIVLRLIAILGIKFDCVLDVQIH